MSQFVKKVLPKADADAYAKAKFVVQAHNASAKAWWTAISDIKTNEWYLTEFSSFQEWCQKYSTWTPTAIRQALLEARRAEGRALIAATTNEPIIKDPKPSRSVNKPVSSTSRSDTPIEINKDHSSNTPNGENKPVKPAKDVDEIGTVIPDSLLPLWNRRGELGYLIRQVEAIRSEIITRKKESDPLFVKVAQEIIGHLDWVHKELVDATPDMVCGICQGRHVEIHKGFCKSCGSTGFMSKYEFKTLVPEEWAKIRKQK